MTRVEFIFNVSNKLAKTAQLCDNAVTKGRQLTISSQDETLYEALQHALWHYSPTSFLPMIFLDKSQHNQLVASQCAIHFSLNVEATQPHILLQDDVLIHFHDAPPPFFSRFRYLVELVGVEEQDKMAARTRYKFYRDRGYDIKTTNMAQTVSMGES